MIYLELFLVFLKIGAVAFGGGYKGDTETVNITGGVYEQDVIRYVSGADPVVLFAKNS